MKTTKPSDSRIPPLTVSSSKLQAPALADRTNGQFQTVTDPLRLKSEPTPSPSGPTWSEASQRMKASLDRFFATGKHSSDSDDETAVPDCNTSKAAVICQSLRRRSLPSDRGAAADEDLPDLAPRPFIRSILRNAAPDKKPMLAIPKSKALGSVATAPKNFRSACQKSLAEPDAGESKCHVSTKCEGTNAETPTRTEPLTPFFRTEEVPRTDGASALQQQKMSCEVSSREFVGPIDLIKETNNGMEWRANEDARNVAPYSVPRDWTNVCRACPPSSPITSTQHAKRRLFTSPKREVSGACSPFFCRDEVVPSSSAAVRPSPSVKCEVSHSEIDASRKRCVEREMGCWTTEGCTLSPGIQCSRSHNCTTRISQKWVKWERCAIDTEDDEPAFAHCAMHVKEEALFAMWYRQFVSRRRQAAKAWKECGECQVLHSVYNSPGLPAELGHSSSRREPVQTCNPVEVITIANSDDDTKIIELSSGGEDSDGSPRKAPTTCAAKGRRAIREPSEVISISDDDTVELGQSLGSDELETSTPAAAKDCEREKSSIFKDTPGNSPAVSYQTKSEAPNFEGVPSASKNEPVAPNGKDGTPTHPRLTPNLEAFEFHKSPKAADQQVRIPRKRRCVTRVRNYTPVENSLITKYFQASPKSESTTPTDDTSGPEKTGRPDALGSVPKREPIQRWVDARNQTELIMIEEDSEDEFEAPKRTVCSTPRSPQRMVKVAKLNHGIEQLVYNCMEAKGPYLPMGLQLIYDCCTAEAKPSCRLVTRLLTTWQGTENASEAQQCYSALTNLQKRHRVLRSHNLWRCLNKAASVLETSSDPVRVEANNQLVHFVTRAMEDDLEQVLADRSERMIDDRLAAKHSLVYKWLNPMMESARIRVVQQWMANSVVRNHSGDVAGRLSLFIRRVSQLLEMAIKVCVNQRECSKSMANNFCSIYAQLPLWGHRRALVDQIRPALLQSIFLATLLENRASRLHISEDCTRTYLARRLDVEKITNYFFLMGPLSFELGSEVHLSTPSRSTEEHFEELLFLQFNLLRSHLEAAEETVRSSEISKLLEARMALLNLEAQCYRDCPDLHRNIPFQQTLACFSLLFV